MCYDAHIMKRTALEPGLVQGLRIYVMVATVLLPVIWYIYSPMLSADATLDQFIRPTLPVLIFLLIYTTFPWWQQRMGRAFLPVALLLIGAQAIAGNYLTLQYLIPPPMRELALLPLMLRLWVTFQFLVLFVAWQYDLFWALVGGIAMCLLDAALAFPMMNRSGTLYPLYVTLVVGRLISVTSVGLGLAWLMKRQREQRAELADANTRLRDYAIATEHLSASRERNRLARELHDTLAHSLSGVTVQLEAVEALWDVNAGAARQMLDQAMASTRNGLTEARRALQSLRASPLEDLGLELAVKNLAESASARANLSLDVSVGEHLDNLPFDVEQCIFRVVQEAFTNIIRHADARSIRLSLFRQGKGLLLTVTDDGCGFDPSSINDARYGLRGLYERAEAVGGTLQVESRIREGTTIRLAIPTLEVER